LRAQSSAKIKKPINTIFMRPNNILAFMVVMFLPMFLTASVVDGKVKNSEIKKVTVFLKGAQIQRECEIAVPSGTTDLVIGNLSPKIDAGSLQAKASGELMILSVKLRTNFLEKRQNTIDRKALDAKVDALNDQISEARMLKSVYDGEQNLLIANQTLGSENEGFTVQQLRETSEFFRTRLLEIRSKILELDQKISKWDEEAKKIREQLSESEDVEKTPTGEVVISLSSKKETTGTLTLDYYIPDAAWVPFYDARVEEVNKPVELSRKAQVSQNTGEDWNKVSLTLSSANPLLSGRKPELATEYLKYVEFYKRKSNLVLQNAYGDIAEETVANQTATRSTQTTAGSNNSYSPNVTLESSSTRRDFVISVPYTIPSDNKNYTVAIGELTIQAEYEYQIVPKIEPSAFIVARITNWEEFDLLSGTVNLYFQKTYIGKTFLNMQNVADTLGFSLGRDPYIVTTRKNVKEFTSEEVIGSDKKVMKAWEITVRNTKRTAVNIVLEDQIPVSQSRDVEVDLLDNGQGKFDEKTGKLTWSFKLEPSGSKQFTFKYKVKYPKSGGVYSE
jgi:uncharacterized protein (TIGR02231 family)